MVIAVVRDLVYRRRFRFGSRPDAPGEEEADGCKEEDGAADGKGEDPSKPKTARFSAVE
jgi:hypothetical protein